MQYRRFPQPSQIRLEKRSVHEVAVVHVEAVGRERAFLVERKIVPQNSNRTSLRPELAVFNWYTSITEQALRKKHFADLVPAASYRSLPLWVQAV